MKGKLCPDLIIIFYPSTFDMLLHSKLNILPSNYKSSVNLYRMIVVFKLWFKIDSLEVEFSKYDNHSFWFLHITVKCASFELQ